MVRLDMGYGKEVDIIIPVLRPWGVLIEINEPCLGNG